ncbi:MAG: glutathione S-transferase family protein [Rhodobacteraceae bacterium]|nr:glutathione S-transferase family protein [Paracoccaceae bacterium]
MIRLHHCPQTRSMRALWLLHELGVDFEVQEWPFDKTLRSPEFRALNPAGRIPALELDGETIWESGAMIEVLCERFPEAGLGRDAGHPERARFLTWIHFAETISQHAAALTQQHVALRDDAMRSPIVMQLEAARIGKCYAALEEHLGEYLLDAFSAADIAVGQAVYMARHFKALDGYPKTLAWYDRITARPPFASSLPGEAKLYPQDFYEAWEVVE